MLSCSARNVWMRSCNRNNGNNVAYVNASGNCNNNNAINGNRGAADCVGGERKGSHIVELARSIGTRSLHLVGECPAQYRGDGTRALRDARSITAEDVIGFDALWESMWRCAEEVKWKDSVASFILNGADSISKLSDDLHDGTYKPRRSTHFTITSPKRREVVAQSFRDRVYHRSMVDNLVYPCLAPTWIYDNAACQRGKGTDFARARFRKHLQQAYSRWGTDVWTLSMDVHGYYASISHARAERMLEEHLPEWGARMVIDALRAHYPSDYGYNPGSDIVQMIGISFLAPIDHYVTSGLGLGLYGRYMDDLRVTHGSMDVLEACLDGITERLTEIELEPHPHKTFIRHVSVPNTYLGFEYRMTRSGKVTMTVKPENVKSMRRRVGRLSMLEQREERPRGTTDVAYDGWRAHAEHGDSQRELGRCDDWYEQLVMRRLSAC